jgi:PLP dependent protein
MHKSIINLIEIEKKIHLKNTIQNLKTKIIAVSKTFPLENIFPLINHGHIDFGENKVQEAIEKWTEIKKKNSNIKLHMIGKLQTNKVKFVIPLFDYIHSLDNIKLAKKISSEEKKLNKKLKIFIQINIGNEEQKSGIGIDEIENFYNTCVHQLNLDIIGLMCLPPKNLKVDNYFSKMKKLRSKINVKELSMGMSDDYLEAINHEASFVRIGSKIFGNRN